MERFHLPRNLDTKKYSSRWIKLWLQKEATPKSQWFYPRKVCFSLTPHARQGSAWSSHHSHSEHLTDGCSVLTSVSTITKTDKRGNWYRQTAIKYFCPEVMHVCFAHICLAKASHLATHSLNVAERCSLLPGELKRLRINQ